MSNFHNILSSLDCDPLPAAAHEFLNYCEIEYERRASSGNPFDERLFSDAIELVINKLRHLENRGCT